MKKRLTGLLLAGLSLFLLEACKTNPASSAEQSKSTPFDAAYYESLSNNTERLQMLKAGLFAQYIMEKDSSLSAWTQGDDSVYLYTVPVGDPHKEGHWVLITQFLSSLPDEPLSVWFEKIERMSRDSFGVWSYEWPLEDFVGYSQIVREGINLEELGVNLPKTLPGPPRSIYFREGPAHFRELPLPRSVPKRYEEKKVSYRKVFVDLQPIGSYFQPHYFDKDSLLMGKGATNALLRKTKKEEARVAGFYEE